MDDFNHQDARLRIAIKSNEWVTALEAVEAMGDLINTVKRHTLAANHANIETVSKLFH